MVTIQQPCVATIFRALCCYDVKGQQVATRANKLNVKTWAPNILVHHKQNNCQQFYTFYNNFNCNQLTCFSCTWLLMSWHFEHFKMNSNSLHRQTICSWWSMLVLHSIPMRINLKWRQKAVYQRFTKLIRHVECQERCSRKKEYPNSSRRGIELPYEIVWDARLHT